MVNDIITFHLFYIEAIKTFPLKEQYHTQLPQEDNYMLQLPEATQDAFELPEQMPSTCASNTHHDHGYVSKEQQVKI